MSDCGGGGSPDRTRGGSPERTRSRAAERTRGRLPAGGGGTYGGLLGGTYGWAAERTRVRLPEQTRDDPNRAASTSPARDRNLLGMGVNPQDYQRPDQQASTSGTSYSEIDQIREKLLKMRATTDQVKIEAEKVFQNIRAKDLKKELATAMHFGIKPMQMDDPGFRNMASEGNNLKWAITKTGNLLFVPHSVRGIEISHTVLTGGGPVVATGEAILFTTGIETHCSDINNHSGHYRPDESSLEIGKQAFRASGIVLDGIRSGAVDQQASTFRDVTLEYIRILDAVKNSRLEDISDASNILDKINNNTKNVLVDIINKRVKRIQEVDSAVKIARGDINSNKDHHIFDKPVHHWDLTGLDRQKNWDLIETTLLNKYEIAKTMKPDYEVEATFGKYKVSVTGTVVRGAVRISDAWVNPT